MLCHLTSAILFIGLLIEESVEKCFDPVVEKLKPHRCKLPRMIIYCSKYDDCSMLNRFFKHRLAEHFTETIGAPDHSILKLVDMYTSLTHSVVKMEIIPSPLRMIICTIAYGMGIDCSNVQQIVH